MLSATEKMYTELLVFKRRVFNVSVLHQLFIRSSDTAEIARVGGYSPFKVIQGH